MSMGCFFFVFFFISFQWTFDFSASPLWISTEWKTRTWKREKTVCYSLNTNNISDIGFCRGHKHSGNDWIQQFCWALELWKWPKNTPLYIFYRRINNGVSVGASPSVVIASGQPAVSNTDGVFKQGGWDSRRKGLVARVYTVADTDSSCLLRWWKMLGRASNPEFRWFLFRPFLVLNVQGKAV